MLARMEAAGVAIDPAELRAIGREVEETAARLPAAHLRLRG